MININTKLYQNKQWLIDNYKTKTTREIASECNTNHQTVLFWLKKYDIPRRHNKESRIKEIIYPHIDYTKKYRDKDWLISEYKTKTVQQIADENQISKPALLKWFKKFGIKRRKNGESRNILTRKIYFNNINSSIKAYWLGFLMADGCNSDNRLQLHLSTKDEDHLMQFVKDINWTGAINYGESAYGISKFQTLHKWCSIAIGSENLMADIEKLGICSNKTGEESFPKINKKYYCDFIRGYFDGDGCYSYFYRLNQGKYKTLNASIKIACANYNFLDSIKSVLLESCNIQNNKIHIYPNKSIYYLEVSSIKEIFKFYNYIYPKYCRRYLKRKRAKFEETLDYIKSHIK